MDTKMNERQVGMKSEPDMLIVRSLMCTLLVKFLSTENKWMDDWIHGFMNRLMLRWMH